MDFISLVVASDLLGCHTKRMLLDQSFFFFFFCGNCKYVNLLHPSRDTLPNGLN